MTLQQTIRKSFSSPYGPIHWYTWSDAFKEMFRDARHLEAFRNLTPAIEHIKGFDEYNYTYTISAAQIANLANLKTWQQCARDLYNFHHDTGLVFLTDLISKDMTAEEFHKVFTLFRSLIVHDCNDEMESLYTPLTPSNKGFFPLHCDLYIPKKLMNVYEAVPSDKSGASLFLRMDTLIDTILPRTTRMPAAIRRKISSLINLEDRSDKYDMFYNLLNDTDNPWYRELLRRTTHHRFQIKFQKGQGYLLYDRRWLHGRTKPNGGLTIKRVHRLVFNSR
jgi:hypothetical protein